LGLETVEQLEQACKDGRVAKLHGLAKRQRPTSARGLIAGALRSRHLISDALPIADSLLEALRSHPDVIDQFGRQSAEASGSHW